MDARTEDGRHFEHVRRGLEFSDDVDLAILRHGACAVCTMPGLIVWHTDGDKCPAVTP